MTLSEHISSDTFEVINSAKPPNFAEALAEIAALQNPIEDSPVGVCANSAVVSDSQPRNNVYMCSIH